MKLIFSTFIILLSLVSCSQLKPLFYDARNFDSLGIRLWEMYVTKEEATEISMGILIGPGHQLNWLAQSIFELSNTFESKRRRC